MPKIRHEMKKSLVQLALIPFLHSASKTQNPKPGFQVPNLSLCNTIIYSPDSNIILLFFVFVTIMKRLCQLIRFCLTSVITSMKEIFLCHVKDLSLTSSSGCPMNYVYKPILNSRNVQKLLLERH